MQLASFRLQATLNIDLPRHGVVDPRRDRNGGHGVEVDEEDVVDHVVQRRVLQHYLTGPVILVRTNMDGEVISLTIDEVYLFQKYLASHSITLMADDQKLPCICID